MLALSLGVMCSLALQDPVPAVEAADRLRAADDVTIEWLQQVFRDAFVDAEIDEDGDLALEEDGTSVGWIQLTPDEELLNFLAIGLLSVDRSRIDKLEFVNALNSNVIGATFYVMGEDRVVADRYVALSGGITERQLVSMYRAFRDAVRRVGQFDERGVLADGS